MIVTDKVTRQCPQTTTFEEKKRAKADSNQSPSAYQPNTISLGQTDSLLRCVHCAVFCCTDSKWLISLMLFGSQTELAYSRTGLTNAMSCQVSLKRSRSSGFFTIGVGRAYLVDVDASLPGSIWGQHDAQVESIVDWADCLAIAECTGDSVFSCFQCTCCASVADARTGWVWCSYQQKTGFGQLIHKNGSAEVGTIFRWLLCVLMQVAGWGDERERKRVHFAVGVAATQ